MKAAAKYLLDDILAKNIIFKVPVYQRNYAWTKKQCEVLCNDIETIMRTGKPHFLGTVVWVDDEGTKKFIVDGQQRVTTTMILLHALKNISYFGKTMSPEEVNRYLIIKGENKLKLKSIPTDDEQLRNLFFKGRARDNQSNIYRNYEYFLRRWKGYDPQRVFAAMKQLQVAEIILNVDEGDNPQVIFESINSTGMDLSITDLIRNYLLMVDRDQDVLYETKWLILENLLGCKILEMFFADYLTFKTGIDSPHVYEQFKDFFSGSGKTNKDMLDELISYARIYYTFLNECEEYSHSINNGLRLLREMQQGTVYPFLLAVFDDYRAGIIDVGEVEKIIQLIVAYHARRLICEFPSHTLRNFYTSLYRRVFVTNPKNYDRYYAAIQQFMCNINTNDRMPSDKVFYDALKYKNIISKGKLAKLIFTRLNGHALGDRQKINLEHIMPVKPDQAWREYLGNPPVNEYESHVHRIGNITITGASDDLTDKSFDEKKEIIKSCGNIYGLNKDIIGYVQWSFEAIENRSERLANEIEKMFVFERTENETEILFESIEDSKHYFSEGMRVIFTKPSKVVLFGEHYDVSSWCQALTTVADKLYEKYPDRIERIASIKWYGSSRKRLIAHNENDVENRRPNRIANSNIYIGTNLNADAIVGFIDALLRECNVSPSNAYYYLREKV